MTSDHGRWPFSLVQLLCSNFFKIPIYKAFGPLTKCNPNVDQEEWPCTKKWMCWFFLIYAQKVIFEKIKLIIQVWPFSCFHFLVNVSKMWLANLLTTNFTKQNGQFHLYMFNVIYMWHVLYVVYWALPPALPSQLCVMNGWNCMDWPQVTWDPVWTGPKMNTLAAYNGQNPLECSTCIYSWLIL
jgi:hypothetical protein